MNANALRVGVVGAGYWGPNLIRNCAELGVLDSVCDIDETALAATSKSDASIFTTTQFEALLARPVDAVIIAAPAQLHASMSIKALAAGKHVFVEKPLALSVEEGDRIADAARAAGRTVFVGHLLLYHPAVKKLRSLIKEGLIGRIWHVRSRRLGLGKLRSHENVWWSFAPHDVALMLAIMGEEPQTCSYAETCGRGTSISDVAYADFEFSGHRSAHIEVCWLDPEKSARLDVFGSEGVITWSDSRSGGSLHVTRLTTAEDPRGIPTVQRGADQHVPFEQGEAMRAELLAFMDSIATGQPAETDVGQGIAVLRALAMADSSGRERLELRALA